MALAKVDIFNLALTFLGAQNITSVNENSKNAKAILQVYDMIRRGELRKLPHWNFAVKLASLAASTTEPLFDRAYAYPLPADCLKVMAPYPESNYNDRDWLVQDGSIFTNEAAPLNIRYIADVEDTTKFDPLFANALAAQLALATADQLTQSKNRVESAGQRYELIIRDARKANAFENVAVQAPIDTYLSVRN